jgi:Domain of unknown function (DUF4333)
MSAGTPSRFRPRIGRHLKTEDMSTAPPDSTHSSTRVPARVRPEGLRRARPCGLAAAVLVAPTLLGCGSSGPTLNNAAVERAIAKSILTQRDLHATVACPSDVPLRAGQVFKCRAMLEVGTYPISVTETNGSGHIRFSNSEPLVILDIPVVEREMAQSIFSQRHVHATVTCPTQVLRRAGVYFTCTATVSGQRHVFAVTEIDDKGTVRYVATR